MKSIAITFLCAFSIAVNAQNNTPTFTTSGKQILDPCGNAFIPKGLNYSLADDWDFPNNLNSGSGFENAELSSEIIKANPNTVRIQWYAHRQAGWAAYDISDLDSVISRFSRADIVSVLELHDMTGMFDSAAFVTTILDWWTSPEVVSLLNKHESHIILNIANEYGPVKYPASLNYQLDPQYDSKILKWVNHMTTAIRTLRDADITVPIMIDAPNWGHAVEVLLAHGTTWHDADALNRIVLSAHAYWSEDTNQDILNKITAINVFNLPIILGEVAAYGEPCPETTVDLETILGHAQNNDIGWLAWTWSDDYCMQRRLASGPAGLFNNLTASGNLVVNNPAFGLAQHAVKACFQPSTSINTPEHTDLIYTIAPNPAHDHITLTFQKHLEGGVTIMLTDITGRAIAMNAIRSISPNTYTVQLPSNNAKGLYLVHINVEDQGRFVSKIIVR